MTSISLNSVGKQFGSLVAVKSVDALIDEGEFISIVGPSGCGKTTTLRVIAGLEEASSGEVLFGDNEVTDDPPEKRNVGMVFQNLALYPHMSVRDNMEFGLRVDGVPDNECGSRVTKVAKMLDIEELLDRSPAELSGGQQQRVAIGRTMVLDPDVFLLDEPLASLDAKLRVEIREELQELHRQVGVTTVYVTHDQEQAMTMSDRIIVMNDGEIQQFATPDEVYNHPNNEFVAHFIGTPSMNFIDCELARKGDTLYADLGFDSVKIDENQAARSLANGDSVRLGVRPEHVDLCHDNEEGFTTNVKFVEPTGKDKIVHLNVGDEDLKAIVEGEENVVGDETRRMAFRSDCIHLFETESGECVY
ncbi:ABC transporter ATP-binding protein [Haladaptatus pallidirubidus]|uniref:ABC-type D-xylose/L-arabinose transporter n=1 Tax=Haladaptatus pallidirubidus TaxID=1008152 RepID=A0AAV3US37_9EURY|nr:ABC transporter ATP-binding protein [Haladaptatus pallidirubidus]